jgi:hypothetical protein
LGNNGTITIMIKKKCEYNLQINLNGLKQQIIHDLSTIVCKICIDLLLGKEQI